MARRQASIALLSACESEECLSSCQQFLHILKRQLNKLLSALHSHFWLVNDLLPSCAFLCCHTCSASQLASIKPGQKSDNYASSRRVMP